MKHTWRLEEEDEDDEMDDGDDVVVGASAVKIIDYFNICELYCLCLTSKILFKMKFLPFVLEFTIRFCSIFLRYIDVP